MHNVPSASCPTCHTSHVVATGIDYPVDGDLTVCACCGECLRFADSLRALQVADVDFIDPATLMLVRFMRAALPSLGFTKVKA